ncbi:MAG: DNA-directed RNA polymerase subunit omega [Acidobacteria bacterium]|nr:MAG: DNA-directed RNA polymerase subunit omega [Acidobacteriota bacterium]
MSWGPFASVEDVPSRYQFVHVVARRARKLQGGAKPLVTPNSRKFTRIAQQEAMSGLLEFTFLNAAPAADGTQPGAEA